MAWDPPLGGRATGYTVPATEWNKINGSLVDLARVYQASGTTIDVVNTVTETAIFSQSLEANLLSSNGSVRLSLLCDYLNNSGANRNLTVRVKLGATTMFGDARTAITVSANRRVILIDLILGNLNATNSQMVQGTFQLTAATAGSVAGTGILDGATSGIGFMGTAAEDTTSAKTLAVTMEHSAANANLSVRARYATLMHMPLP